MCASSAERRDGPDTIQPMNRHILVADDDPDIVLMLTDRLEALGHTVLSAGDGQRALALLESGEPELVLLDLEMPKMTGLDVLQALAERGRASAPSDAPSMTQSEDEERERLPSGPPIIVMTAHGTVQRAVEAMKCGAYDFLTKPLDMDHLTLVMDKALERETLKRHVTVLRKEVESRYSTVVASTPAMTSLIELAKRAADSDATVLLLGESGTGKELFARSIHQWSRRAAMPFVVINCVALPATLLENELFGHEKGAFTGAAAQHKGNVEMADGGTLFLDEIGDMAPDLQAKLLRLLQDREFHRVGGTRVVRVNLRVIAATNRNLAQAVKTGAFREDLFHRLDVISFSMPPLRERADDIPRLADLFLQRAMKEMGKPGMSLTASALRTMCAYSWPGNVRELENAVARAVVLSTDPAIAPEQLRLPDETSEASPVASLSDLPYHEAIENFRHVLIAQALTRAHGNQTRAAEALGIQRSYLARMLKQKQGGGKERDDTT